MRKPFVGLFAVALIVGILPAAPSAAQVVGTDVTYTSDADFDQGTLISVNHNAPFNDQLQLDSPTQPFPFINIAASGRGTVVRANTDTGEIVGEYRTAPEGRGLNPSRTTVDLFGNVWTANREEVGLIDGVPHGSGVKIGLIVGGTRVDSEGTPDPAGDFLAPPFGYSTCVDRDEDGLIRTSKGLSDILAWPDVTDGTGGPDGLVQDAEDECILIYQRLADAEQARHVSVDADNNVWVGGFPFQLRHLHKLDGATGTILDSFDARDYGCGGYGGLVDGNGTLWSVGWGTAEGSLLRYDPATRVGSCVNTHGGYGLGIDTNGYVWTSIWDNGIAKVSPGGVLEPGFPKSTWPTSGGMTATSNTATAGSYTGSFLTEPIATPAPSEPAAQASLMPAPSKPQTPAQSPAEETVASAAELTTPTFQVAPQDDWIGSTGGWGPGATISLTIEDGGGVVYTDSQTADGSGNFSFELWDVFDVQRGHVVTVSDGTNTKTHTVTDVKVTDIDTTADTVSGTAGPNAWVEVSAYLFADWAARRVQADAAGNWSGDFSGLFDITDATFLGVEEYDDDGDSTWRRFGPPVQANRGVAVTPIDNHVWVANSGVGTVTRLDNDGDIVKVIETGDVPTGVAVDAAGMVWVTNLGSDNAVRIDPAGGADGLGAIDLTVDLGEGASPYNYSDMTGAVVVGSTSPQGLWTVVQDSGELGFEWGRVTWNTEPEGSEPAGTEIIVETRTADTEAGLGGLTFIPVPNGELFSSFGRFIEVRVTLRASPEGHSPVLSDIRVQPALIEVDVDIKPGSYPNSINIKRTTGVIPVAVLGTGDFDVTSIDVATLRFGPAQAMPEHDLADADTHADHLRDVNEDGVLDLVSHYVVGNTGLDHGHIEACLIGQTLSGIPIEGCDSVRILGKP